MTDARIRPARVEDAAAIAALTTQLGYAVDAEGQARRLAPILASDRDAVLVATDAADRPIGWIHVQRRLYLEGDDQALIAGLVVDEEHRSSGIGAALLAAAEEWATAHDLRSMRVQSRVERAGAHRFYERHGYAVAKTSLVFDRPIHR
ncbi:MAG TPA: GNAT family N-acetyltransferase [Candidatus Limnocylindria bacterium]|nr:GNAT family N-acetyltransferase [Candidatus Limnocylindria bacterium]